MTKRRLGVRLTAQESAREVLFWSLNTTGAFRLTVHRIAPAAVNSGARC